MSSQAPHLILALHIVPVLGLVQVASDKVLAALTSSMWISVVRSLLLVVIIKAHERCASVEGTMCRSNPRHL